MEEQIILLDSTIQILESSQTTLQTLLEEKRESDRAERDDFLQDQLTMEIQDLSYLNQNKEQPQAYLQLTMRLPLSRVPTLDRP